MDRGPPLSRHRVLLLVHGLSYDDQAVLYDGRGVPEDEVDGAGDEAVPVELAVGLDVEGVLEGVHAAVEEGGHVGLDAERHRLVALRAGGVAEAHGLADEVVADDAEGGGLEGGDAVLEALLAGDDGLSRAVAVHVDVDLIFGDGDVLVVDAGLDVDDVTAAVEVLGVGVEGVLDGLVLGGAVLGDDGVWRRLAAGGEELPVGGLHP